jgi:hypothetical protein
LPDRRQILVDQRIEFPPEPRANFVPLHQDLVFGAFDFDVVRLGQTLDLVALRRRPDDAVGARRYDQDG